MTRGLGSFVCKRELPPCLLSAYTGFDVHGFSRRRVVSIPNYFIKNW